MTSPLPTCDEFTGCVTGCLMLVLGALACVAALLFTWLALTLAFTFGG